MLRVTLNSNDYVCAEPLEWSYVEQRSAVFRLEGTPVREDNPVISRLPYGWEKGMGWERMDRVTGSGVGGGRDFRVETRWPIAELPLLNESNAHANASDHAKVYENFSGDLYCGFEGEYRSGSKNVVGVGKWSPDTFSAVDAPSLNGTSNGTQISSTTITQSHTVQSTGPNRIVVAFPSSEDTGGNPEHPSGVTYAGQAMTQVVTANQGNLRASIWRLVNPTTGANNCVATFSNSQSISHIGVADYYYVNQSTPFGSTATDTGSGTSGSAAVTTVAGDLAIMQTVHSTTEAHAVGAGQTEYYEQANNFESSASEERATGTTTTMSTSWSTSDNFAIVAAPLNGAGLVTFSTTNGNGVRLFDLKQHKGSLIALCSEGQGAETQFEWFHSTDGDAWTKGAGTGWPATTFLTTTITRRNNFDDDEAKILDFGNTMLMALHDNRAAGTGQSIRIFYTTDNGSNWTAGAVIPSGSGPKAWVRWKDPFTSPAVDSPTLITAEGVYRVDVGGTTFDRIIELDGDSNNGRWSVVGQDGDLYIGLGSGYIRGLHATGEGGWTSRTVGPPGDGLVAARQGHVNYMIAPDWEWLVVAYGGHASSRNASVFYIEYHQQTDERTGKVFQAWHHAYIEADANIDIVALAYSAADDATTRLLFALENATSSEMFHLERPDISPKGTGIAVKHSTSVGGLMQFADDAMGDPNLSATVLQALVDADDLSLAATGTSNEFIDYKNGLDGGAWNANDIGNFYSDDLDLSLGSGAGVSARRIRNELTLNSGTEANSPALRDFEIQAFKQQSTLRQIKLEIDTEATRDQTGVVPETQIANLETIMDNGTLVSFTIGGLSAVRVRIRERPRFKLVTEDKGDGVGLGNLTGKLTVVVEEAL